MTTVVNAAATIHFRGFFGTCPKTTSPPMQLTIATTTSERWMPKTGTSRNAADSDPAMPPSVLSADREPMVRPAVSIDLHDAPMASGYIAPMQSAGGKTTAKLITYLSVIHCHQTWTSRPSAKCIAGSRACRRNGEANPQTPMHTKKAARHAAGSRRFFVIAAAKSPPIARPASITLNIVVKA